MSDVPTQGPDLGDSIVAPGDSPAADVESEAEPDPPADAPAPAADVIPGESPPADTESESEPDTAADAPARDTDVVPGNSPPADADTESEPGAALAPDTDAPAPGGRSRNRNRGRRNRQRQRQRRPDPIVPIPHDLSATREFTGALTEIIPGIGLTALGYADTGPMAVAMAKAMLGRRWADEFARITVHTPRQGTGQPGSGQQGANQLESYTALIPAPLISDRRLSRGVTVAVKLTGIDVSDRRRDWYCDELRVVG